MVAAHMPATRQHFEWFCSNFDVRRWTHNAFRARAVCPGHDDHDPSLDIDFKDGEILMTCRAGCSNERVLEAVGLTFADFWPGDEDRVVSRDYVRPKSQSIPWGQPTAEWMYPRRDGSIFGKVERFDPPGMRKQFKPWHQNGAGMVPGKGTDLWPLYRANHLASWPSGTTVYLAAGEKCADAVADLGLPSTTHQGGENAWDSRYAAQLDGFNVVVLEDNDEAGRGWGAKVARDLEARGIQFRLVRFPDLPQKGDVFDWIAQGHSADDLKTYVANHVVAADEPKSFDPAAKRAPRGEPVLADEALHGLAGDVVRTFDPNTEAHPAAVLVSFLVFFGNCVGSSPETWVGETRHSVNLAAVIAGATSRSRKGTSSSPIERIFKLVDTDWLYARRTDGIGSGESIIWEIRDPAEPTTNKRGETVVEDEGVRDKRLMVHEEEFSAFLKVANRDGSIAGEVFRKAWDSRPVLRNTVKRSPVKASNPHVSVLGHITIEELRRELTETDQANGVGNRVLWVFAKRSKLLPTSPRTDERVVAELAQRVSQAIRRGRKGGQIRRSHQAEMLWAEIYPDLSKDYPGMFGALTARAEAQVLRLSMIYALLDCSNTIEVEHLVAALALWQYCEDSARYIFGDRLGDPVADRILSALRASGELRETDIHELFGRHKRADAITRALEVLMTHGLARLEVVATGGRSARTWRLA